VCIARPDVWLHGSVYACPYATTLVGVASGVAYNYSGLWQYQFILKCVGMKKLLNKKLLS